MGKRVPYGEADFKKVRTEGYLYIDKTMYIEKLEKYSKIIFTKPRRFGKSMLTSMLGYYYSIGETENFEKIFKGLYVYDHPTPYKNSYYILQFNFSGIDVSEYKTLDEIERSFNNKIRGYLGKFIGVNNLGITFDRTRTAAGMLSEVLMKFSELHKENSIYIMIDEYDHFTNGMLYGDAKRFLGVLGASGFVRAFYEVIKENLEGMNPPIGRFFATGVAPITLDSLTSGFNIATKLTNNPIFTSMCGLTEDEVKYAIEEAGVQTKEEAFSKMKENYDGYMFNKLDQTHLFNTTLVMYYLSSLQMIGMPPENLVDSNLAATGSKIENIASLINKDANYKVLDELLMNGEIEGNIVDSFELENHFDKNDFLSMLFYNGYITIGSVGVRTRLKIPNYVTEILYASYFLKLVDRHNKYRIDISEIEEAMQELAEEGNIEKITNKVKDFLFHCSVRDRENFNEMNLKHVFSMFLALTTQYIVYGEYPVGQGFADMYIAKSANSLATYEAVVELKYLNKEKARKFNFKKSVKDAKEQLCRYLEDKRMNNKENLKKFVIVFEGFEEFYIEEL